MTDTRARADAEDLWDEQQEYRRARDQSQRPQRTRPLAQVEIETAIAAIVEDLERTTEDYAEISDEAAEAEHAYKLAMHRSVIVLSDRGTKSDGSKATVQWIEAQAYLACADEYRAHLVADARLKATKEALVTKRSRLDALRTLAANVRGMV